MQAWVQRSGLADKALDEAAHGLPVTALLQLTIDDDARSGKPKCPGLRLIPAFGRIGHPLPVAPNVLRLQRERGRAVQRQVGHDVDERIGVDARMNAHDEHRGRGQCAGWQRQVYAVAQVLLQRLGGVVEQVAQVVACMQTGGHDGVQALCRGWSLAGAVGQLAAQRRVKRPAIQGVGKGHVLTGTQGSCVAGVRRRAAGCCRCRPEAQQRQQRRGGPGSQPHGLTGTAGARCARGASRASGPDRIPAAHAVSRTTGPGGRRARGAAS